MTLVHWDDVEGGHWQLLGAAAGATRVGAQHVVLHPGETIAPPYAHPAEEEIHHVLDGSATLWQDGATCNVGAGDTIVHVAGGPAHALIADDAGLEVLVFATRSYAVEPWNAAAAPGIPKGTPGERPANVVALDDLEGAFGGLIKHAGRAAGAKQSGLNWGTLPPNDEGAPPHCHSADEEVFVILEGEGVLELWAPAQPGDVRQTEPQETHAIRRGHVVVRPPATRISHSFRAGDGGMTYLAYGTREPNDMCYYPRSNKVFLRGLGVIARLELLEYGDGEPS